MSDTEEGYEGSTVSQKTLTTGLSGGVHATDKKLGRPKAREVGREAGGGASLYQSLKPDPTARQPGAFHGQLKHRWGLHAKGLQTSSKGQRTATGGGWGGVSWGQMHNKQHQRFPVQQSFARGEDPGGSGREQDGVPMVSGAWIRRRHAPHSSDNHNSGPQTGEMMNGVHMSLTGGEEELQVAMREPQGMPGHWVGGRHSLTEEVH